MVCKNFIIGVFLLWVLTYPRTVEANFFHAGRRVFFLMRMLRQQPHFPSAALTIPTVTPAYAPGHTRRWRLPAIHSLV